MAFPAEHWSKLRSTNPLERVNREIGRRSDVVGIYPNDAALVRLAGALLIEQNDEWLVGRRYLSAESLAGLYATQRTREAAALGRRSSGRWSCSRPDDPDDDQELHHVEGLDPESLFVLPRNRRSVCVDCAVRRRAGAVCTAAARTPSAKPRPRGRGRPLCIRCVPLESQPAPATAVSLEGWHGSGEATQQRRPPLATVAGLAAIVVSLIARASLPPGSAAPGLQAARGRYPHKAQFQGSLTAFGLLLADEVLKIVVNGGDEVRAPA